MKCIFSHHKDYNTELGKCPKHPEEDLQCGPFTHKVCLKCNTSLTRKCGICGAIILHCCC